MKPKPKPEIMWAVWSPSGGIIHWTVDPVRQCTISKFVEGGPGNWRQHYRYGCRCVKVKVVPV